MNFLQKCYGRGDCPPAKIENALHAARHPTREAVAFVETVVLDLKEEQHPITGKYVEWMLFEGMGLAMIRGSV